MVAAANRYRLPLLGSLLIVVGLELCIHRAVLQLLKPEVLEPESDLFRLFNGGVGPLFLYFASFLALAACGWILLLVVREDGVFTLPWRVVLGLFSCVFLPVCAVGIFVSNAGLRPLSHSLRALHPYLNLFFAPMLAAVVSGLVARPGSVAAKVGVILFSLPLLGFAYFSYRTALLLGQTSAGVSLYEQLRSVSAIPQWLRTLFMHSGPLVFLAFMPMAADRSASRATSVSSSRSVWRAYLQVLLEPAPLMVGIGLGLLVGVGVKLGFEPLRIGMDAALAMDMPPASGGTLLFLGSLALGGWTVAALAWRAGPTRTTALGLVALGIAGMRLGEPLHSLQLPDPLYYVLAVIGLLGLSVGIAGAAEQDEEQLLRERSPAIDDDRWLAFLGRSELAMAGQGDREPSLRCLVDQGMEITGFESRYGGFPTALYVRRLEGRLESLSLVLGEALGQAPDWCVASRKTRWWRREQAIPTVIQDRAELSARLLGEGLGGRLAELSGGVVEVWSKVGLRYRLQAHRAQELDRVIPVTTLAQKDAPMPTPEGLMSLLGLLGELARRAGVGPRSETGAVSQTS